MACSPLCPGRQISVCQPALQPATLLPQESPSSGGSSRGQPAGSPAMSLHVGILGHYSDAAAGSWRLLSFFRSPSLSQSTSQRESLVKTCLRRTCSIALFLPLSETERGERDWQYSPWPCTSIKGRLKPGDF